MNDVKPGWKTTEFWITLLGQVLALLVALGVVQTSDAGLLGNALSNSITAIATLLANALIVVNYVRGRAHLKATQLENVP